MSVQPQVGGHVSSPSSERRNVIAGLREMFNPWMLGLLALALPTLHMLFTRVWASDEQGHGPIILGVTLWLAWQRRDALRTLPDRADSIVGWLFLLFGLAGYVIGRSQYVDTLEVLSLIAVISAVLLLSKGMSGLKWGGFFLFFLLFMIPLPGVFVQAITTPLKIGVSVVAEATMHLFDLPVSRTGVIIYISQYQMLVADACAGLNSIFTLEALGLLYLNMMGHTSVRRNALLAVCVVPIAFVANVTRVIVLVLVTYYLGDEAGQGFLHGFAGMLLFVIALTLMISLDALVGRIPFLAGEQKFGEQQ
ncbi:MAG: exosortase B [Burkholderiales bacterium]|nr:exosortase B [Burkholderiales bacterium]